MYILHMQTETAMLVIAAPKITWLRHMIATTAWQEWRMYRVGDGWMDGTPESWRTISDCHAGGSYLIYDPRPR